MAPIGLDKLINKLYKNPRQEPVRLFQEKRDDFLPQEEPVEIPPISDPHGEILHRTGIGSKTTYNEWERQLIEKGLLRTTVATVPEGYDDDAYHHFVGVFHPDDPFIKQMVLKPQAPVGEGVPEQQEVREEEKKEEEKARETTYKKSFKVNLQKFLKDDDLNKFRDLDRDNQLNSLWAILTNHQNNPMTVSDVKKQFHEVMVQESTLRAVFASLAIQKVELSSDQLCQSTPQRCIESLSEHYTHLLDNKNDRLDSCHWYLAEQMRKFAWDVMKRKLHNAQLPEEKCDLDRGFTKDEDEYDTTQLKEWQHRLDALVEWNRDQCQTDVRARRLRRSQLMQDRPKIIASDPAIGIAAAGTTGDPKKALLQILFLLENQILNKNAAAENENDATTHANHLLEDVSKLIMSRVHPGAGQTIVVLPRDPIAHGGHQGGGDTGGGGGRGGGGAGGGGGQGGGGGPHGGGGAAGGGMQDQPMEDAGEDYKSDEGAEVSPRRVSGSAKKSKKTQKKTAAAVPGSDVQKSSEIVSTVRVSGSSAKKGKKSSDNIEAVIRQTEIENATNIYSDRDDFADMLASDEVPSPPRISGKKSNGSPRRKQKTVSGSAGSRKGETAATADRPLVLQKDPSVSDVVEEEVTLGGEDVHNKNQKLPPKSQPLQKATPKKVATKSSSTVKPTSTAQKTQRPTPMELLEQLGEADEEEVVAAIKKQWREKQKKQKAQKTGTPTAVELLDQLKEADEEELAAAKKKAERAQEKLDSQKRAATESTPAAQRAKAAEKEQEKHDSRKRAPRKSPPADLGDRAAAVRAELKERRAKTRASKPPTHPKETPVAEVEKKRPRTVQSKRGGKGPQELASTRASPRVAKLNKNKEQEEHESQEEPEEKAESSDSEEDSAPPPKKKGRTNLMQKRKTDYKKKYRK